jgi:hypothetical protein
MTDQMHMLVMIIHNGILKRQVNLIRMPEDILVSISGIL